MFTWKQILGGLGIAAVIILSSTPFVVLDSDSWDPSTDFCTKTHQKDEAGCRSDKSHHCVWCISRAVASMCYDEATAAELPPAVFKCDSHEQEPLSMDPPNPSDMYCTKTHNVDEASCRDDKDHECVWCISRTFPAMCFDKNTASRLPPSVYQCDFDGQPNSFDVETV